MPSGAAALALESPNEVPDIDDAKVKTTNASIEEAVRDTNERLRVVDFGAPWSEAGGGGVLGGESRRLEEREKNDAHAKTIHRDLARTASATVSRESGLRHALRDDAQGGELCGVRLGSNTTRNSTSVALECQPPFVPEHRWRWSGVQGAAGSRPSSQLRIRSVCWEWSRRHVTVSAQQDRGLVRAYVAQTPRGGFMELASMKHSYATRFNHPKTCFKLSPPRVEESHYSQFIIWFSLLHCPEVV
ncbi:hypothetical protein B0H16DRAFT_1468780 [Mycena metata]|uniref:Uncharacterized protein n=1 Tax=Mycena metata TaxID=1033252 RepID=A0AAD7HZZ3_9AGAR|nr:hypothetical protein B0H16DRAFT_1468780 [Mycena metata]